MDMGEEGGVWVGQETDMPNQKFLLLRQLSLK